jgi:group II intron reverse transcriptase/maturase
MAVVFHHHRERKKRNTARVLRNEGNEVKREGHVGVGAPNSTDETGEPAPRDPVEERWCRGTELEERKMKGTSNPDQETVSTKLLKIAKLAREAPDMVLLTLAHHIDVPFLHEAYRRTRKDGAAGVDGVSAEEYATNLNENLQTLLTRFKKGTYRAPPVRRVHIPKGKNKTRPIGIPTLEDKVLQRAVTMVLEAVYEQDFLEGSYGFRPGRSAHQALDVLWKALMSIGGGIVIEVDISSYFDNITHSHLRAFLDQRVRDGVLRRMIHKWLKAGVMESGNISYPDAGSPQGGVVSPILANVYLHEVMDKWFANEVLPRLRGRAHFVRYADDIVIACARADDAERIMEVLPKRFGKYDLGLHPEKTRKVDFRRPGLNESKGSGSFDFLGFTHYWGKSRRNKWVVKRKTAKDRFNRSVVKVTETCRKLRHEKVKDQHKRLTRMMKGHYAYYGITGNAGALSRFFEVVTKGWQKWLNRRSSGRHVPWERFRQLLKRYPLPRPRIVHSVLRTAANP